MKIVRPKISDQEFLKMFRQKDMIHTEDRESAINIVMNMSIPKTKEFLDNPIFNKVKKVEKELNLHKQDLFSIS